MTNENLPTEEMLAFKVDLGLLLVNFVYLGQEEETDRQFFALCEAVPRIGESIAPESGTKGYVHEIIHKAKTGVYNGQSVSCLVPNVILKDEKPV